MEDFWDSCVGNGVTKAVGASWFDWTRGKLEAHEADEQLTFQAPID